MLCCDQEKTEGAVWGYFLELTLFLEANEWTVDMGPGGCKAGERRSVALGGCGGGFKGFPQGWFILWEKDLRR